MTEAKHTPGPWQYAKDEDDGIHVVHHRVYGSRCSISSSVMADEADMRLIAAAPDMLEALHTCVDALRSRCSIHDKTADGAIGEAVAAIAKATGG